MVHPITSAEPWLKDSHQLPFYTTLLNQHPAETPTAGIAMRR